MKIFSLFGEILLKDNGVENQLDKIDKKASKTDKGMGLSFSNIAKTALKLGAALGVSLGLKNVIEDASEAEAGVSQLNAVLKSTHGAAGLTAAQITDMAGALQKVTKFSDDEILSGQNLLLTFTNIGKNVFPKATETILDMSQALGQDLKSSSVQLGKALNDPIKGITALSRVGVSFTQQQKDQIETLQKAGKVEKAQKIILAELSKEFGGSAKAAGETFGGQLVRVKNQLGEVSENIGGKLLPVLSKFLTKILDNMPQIQDTISNVLDTVVPKFGEWIGLLGQIVNELLPGFGRSATDTKGKVTDLAKNGLNFVTDALTWIRDNMALIKAGVVGLTTVWLIQKGVILAHNIALIAHNIQKGIKKGLDIFETGQIYALIIAEKLHTAATWAGAGAQKALNLVMSMNPIGLVIIAIGALIAIGVILYKKSATFRNFINTLWDNIKKFGAGIGTTFTKVKNDVVGAFEYIWNKISGVANKIKRVWNDIWNFKLPHIPLPHFNITGKLSIAPPSIPKLNIDWYKNGTDFFPGGFAGINEAGGEIINLPRGSQIIPHDISEQMAKKSGDLILQITNFYNNSKEDIEELAEELEFYRQRAAMATGG